ncbi:hypothetical protein [Pseudomonas sp. FEN]|nr:hypothetical protein [Pseudomonas sp. FEN]
MKKLLPQDFHVTKAGSIGNEAPAFFCPEKTTHPAKPNVYGVSQKLARHLL